MIDPAVFQSLAVSHLWQSVLFAGLLAGALILGRRMAGRTRYMLAVTALAASVILPAAAFFPKQQLVDQLLAATGAPLADRPAIPADIPAGDAPPATGAAVSLSATILRSLLNAAEAGPAPLATASPAVSEPAFVFPGLTPPFLAVWGLVAFVLLARTFRDLAAVERMVGRARRITLPPGLAKRLRGIRVAVSPEAPGPMAAGLFRPSIILPEHMADGMDSEELAALLEHERAHIERRDMLAALAQRVLTALLWWSPAVHWISRRMDEEREVACDEAAVARTGDAHAFARSLASQAENQLRRRAPRLAVGAIGPRSHLGRRVRRLVGMAATGVTSSRYSGRVAFSALLLCTGFAVVLTPHLSADTPDGPPEGDTVLDGGSPGASGGDAGKEGRFYNVQYAPARAPSPAPLAPLSPEAPPAPVAPLSPLGRELSALLSELDVVFAGLGPELEAELAGLDAELATLGLEIAAMVNQEVLSELPGIMQEVHLALQDADIQGHFNSQEFREEMEDLRENLRESLGPEFRQELRAAMDEARAEMLAHREEIRESLRDIDMGEIRRALQEAREEMRAARTRGEIPSAHEFERELETILEDISYERNGKGATRWSRSISN